MIIRTILVFVGLVFTYSVSIAAEHKMICKNPRQEYVAVFDDVANTFRVSAPGSDTMYQVETVRKVASGLIIGGVTIDGGPDFTAYTGTNKRIDFLDDGKVFQTDQCRSSS